jgi:hypothetical protein
MLQEFIDELIVRLPHVVGHGISVDVRRGGLVSVAQQALLCRESSSIR